MTAIALKQDDKFVRSLPEICEEEGLPMRRTGNKYASSVCISESCANSTEASTKFSVFVGRDGRWRFKCLACGIYGDSGDFLALARGITLGEALTELYGPESDVDRETRRRRETRAATPHKSPVRDQDAVRHVIAKLRAHAMDPGPLEHLTGPYSLNGRGLCKRAVREMIDSGQLRTLPVDPHQSLRLLNELVGKEALVAAGMLKPDKKWPAIAFRPIICIDPSGAGAEFRLAKADTTEEDGPKAIRYGDMQWPWYHKRNDRPKTLLAVEGFIDMLSAMQLMPEVDAFMGIPGVNGWSPRWFTSFHDRYPDATLLMGFDSDAAGDSGAVGPTKLAESIGMPCMDYRPAQGMDWNDMLRKHSFL